LSCLGQLLFSGFGKNKIKKLKKTLDLLPRFDLSLENYDKMLPNRRSASNKKSKRWNYGINGVGG